MGEKRSSRWIGLLVAAGIGVALTVGWPLVNSALPDAEALPTGRTLEVGPVGDGSPGAARFTVGSGWSLSKSQSSPQQGYRLRNGTVGLSIVYVMPPEPARAGELWSGLRESLLTGDSEVRLGQPQPVKNAQGTTGLTGSYAQGDGTGQATIFPGRAGDFAIETLFIGPPDATTEDRMDAERVIGSIRLTPGGERA